MVAYLKSVNPLIGTKKGDKWEIEYITKNK
jgi:hypothetical protein